MQIRFNSGQWDINAMQLDVMRVIDTWVRTEKTPVPRRHVVKTMKDKGVREVTTKATLRVLLNRGYIRKGVVMSSRTVYVQLRGI